MRDIFATDVFIPTKKMRIYEAIKDVQTALILWLKMLLSLTNIPGRVRVKITAIQSQNGLPVTLQSQRARAGGGAGEFGGSSTPATFWKMNK